MVSFTLEQRAAIYAENPELLVSAAAGSGKTAVLVERIARLILDGKSLDRMLIVTFTNAAAGEMRQRLNKRLRELSQEDPERVADALEALESADICTIHVFCHRFLQREFQAAGLDPTARICRGDESAHLFDQAARDSLSALLDGGDEGVRRLTARFSVADVLDMNGKLHRFLMALSHPYDWLEEKIGYAAERPVREGRWFRAATEKLREALLGVQDAGNRYLAVCREPGFLPALEKTVAFDRSPMMTLDGFLSRDMILEALSTLPESLVSAAPVRKPTPEEAAWHERWKAARAQWKDAIKAARENYGFMLWDEEALAHDLDDAADSLQALGRLNRETHRRFLELKSEGRLLDFNDLEQMTYDLLASPENAAIRQAWQENYDEIFVDECQDVSQIQNDIIAALHGAKNRLFLVGDVKQSIYRFRQANPTLFLERVRTYGRDSGAEKRALFLTRNFRSAAPVLEAANAVFERAMKREQTELDYTPDDRLVPGRTDAGQEKAQVRFFPTDGKAHQVRAAERALAVRAIRETVGSPKPGGGVYTYRDIAILMPVVAGEGASLTETLRDQGIPVYFDGQDAYWELPEIRAAHALLTLMDRPDDELALLAAMKGAPFDFTDGELAEIRRFAPGRKTPWREALDKAQDAGGNLGAKVLSFRETMARWRGLRGVLSLFDLCWTVLLESGLAGRMNGRPGPRARLDNLRVLCEKAAEFEANGGTSLAGFLERVSDEMKESDSRSVRELGEDENLVRVMTMHKSKGLEFPVVVLLGLGYQGRNSAETLSLHRELGLCLPYVNRSLGVKRRVFPETLIRDARLWDERAERCRLFYVAMTRARDRLILCAAGKEDPLWSEPESDSRLARSASMLDWLMPALHDLGENDFFQFICEPDADLETQERRTEDIRTEQWRGQPPRGDLPWLTETPTASPLPRKTSVTSLTSHRVLADPMPLTDQDEEAEDKRVGERILAPLQLSPIPAVPAWLRPDEVSGAARGTANHRFLSLVDLDAVSGAQPGTLLSLLAHERDRLREAGILSPDEAALLRIQSCAAFFESELGRRFLAASVRKREWSFNLRLRERPLLLQGVIDMTFLETDGWVIGDYKTDRIEDDDAFVARHRDQLRWYAEAVRRITGQPVKECWLWSLSVSRAYPVEPAPISEDPDGDTRNVSRETMG